MIGNPSKTLTLLRKLCGDGNLLSKVVLVTTMWDLVVPKEIGQIREEQLKADYWKGMIDLDRQVARFKRAQDVAGVVSAVKVLRIVTDPLQEKRRQEVHKAVDELGAMTPIRSGAFTARVGGGLHDTKLSAYGRLVPRILAKKRAVVGQTEKRGPGQELISKLHELVDRRQNALQRLREGVGQSPTQGTEQYQEQSNSLMGGLEELCQ